MDTVDNALEFADDGSMEQVSTGFVYVIQAGQNGPIKVGFARDVGERLAALQSANAAELRPIVAMPGTYQDEASLHQRLDQWHIRGEWYRSMDDVRRIIAEWFGVRASTVAARGFRVAQRRGEFFVCDACWEASESEVRTIRGQDAFRHFVPVVERSTHALIEDPVHADIAAVMMVGSAERRHRIQPPAPRDAVEK